MCTWPRSHLLNTNVMTGDIAGLPWALTNLPKNFPCDTLPISIAIHR